MIAIILSHFIFVIQFVRWIASFLKLLSGPELILIWLLISRLYIIC